MKTSASPAADKMAQAKPEDIIKSLADDRLEGAEAIGQFIGNKTARETRRVLEAGLWPCWREGKVYVASKRALVAHWQKVTSGRAA